MPMRPSVLATNIVVPVPEKGSTTTAGRVGGGVQLAKSYSRTGPQAQVYPRWRLSVPNRQWPAPFGVRRGASEPAHAGRSSRGTPSNVRTDEATGRRPSLHSVQIPDGDQPRMMRRGSSTGKAA